MGWQVIPRNAIAPLLRRALPGGLTDGTRASIRQRRRPDRDRLCGIFPCPMPDNDPNLSTPAPAEMSSRANAEGAILLSAALAWIGLSISILLVQQHAGGPALFCPVRAGCEAVLSSKYASMLGVPLPWLGVGFYGLMLALILGAYGASSAGSRVRLAGTVVWISVMGASASVVLMYIQFKVLHAFCPLCTGSAVTMILLAVASGMAESRGSGAAFPGRPAAALALALFAMIPAVLQLLPREAMRSEVLAVVDGVKFTRAEMEEEIGAALGPLQQSAYELEFEWMRRKVDGILLAAAKTGKDPQAELAARMAAVKPVADDQITERMVSKGWPGNAENTARAREELLAEAREQARVAFMEELAGGHQIEVLLEQPTIRAMKIDLTTAKISGPRDAKVQLVVFSDFECHFCRELSAVLKRVRADFPNDVMLGYRYFPVESHPRAVPAAIAAECAAEQGAFWEYHDKLYAEGGDLSEGRLAALAGELKLEAAKFSECEQSGRARGVVESSRADAIESGLAGAPALFLNGKMIGGMIAYEPLAARIKEELRAAGKVQR